MHLSCRPLSGCLSDRNSLRPGARSRATLLSENRSRKTGPPGGHHVHFPGGVLRPPPSPLTRLKVTGSWVTVPRLPVGRSSPRPEDSLRLRLATKTPAGASACRARLRPSHGRANRRRSDTASRPTAGALGRQTAVKRLQAADGPTTAPGQRGGRTGRATLATRYRRSTPPCPTAVTA